MTVGQLDDQLPDVRPTRRRRRVGRAACVVLSVLAIGTASLVWWQTRLSFSYEGPRDPVEPGQQVQIRAPGETCGPLIVTLHSPSILGRWNQTHSGNAVEDSFRRDEHPWWSLSSTETFTPVPCALDGSITFTLPEDITATVVAACDNADRCAKVHVTQPDEG